MKKGGKKNENGRVASPEIAPTPICLSIETPKTLNFPFVPDRKLIVLGVPLFA